MVTPIDISINIIFAQRKGIQMNTHNNILIHMMVMDMIFVFLGITFFSLKLRIYGPN